jgi:demethoxyubiquinone hydroxylase (CLK1/Coq7/Cat5 family)
MAKPRAHSTERLYQKHLNRKVNPIVNDDDLNPHLNNTEEMLRKQETKHRKSIRDKSSEPRGAGTFEPSGPNTRYRPTVDGEVEYGQ